jgi:hypothetical protein
MLRNAADRTLGLVNIWQVLRKLLWEVELLKSIPDQVRVNAAPADVLHVKDAKIYAAINAFSTSLALVDWLYHSVQSDSRLTDNCRARFPHSDLTSDKAFLESIRKASRPVNACHQVCNANKHYFLRKPQDGFNALVVELLLVKESGESDVSVALHITHDDRGELEEYSVEAMLAGLVEWWQATLEAIDVPGRDQFFPDAAASCAR